MKTLLALATIFVGTLAANAGTYVIYDDGPVYYAPPVRVYPAPTPPPFVYRRTPVYTYAPSYYAAPYYRAPYYSPAIGFSVGGGWSRVNVIIR